MRPVLTPEEMARADAAAIAAGTPGLVLMERAGRAVARAAVAVAGGRYGRCAALVCGKGNNGGDGLVAARVLADEGVGVRCLFVGDVGSVRGDAAEHLAALARSGVTVHPFDPARLRGADVIVDALFGTGFRGAAEGPAAAAIAAINDHPAPVVAVDIPSGVDGARGRVEGPAVRAELTVAMAAEKVGTAVTPGAVYAGRVEVADIGIPVTGLGLSLLERADVAAVLPERAPESHKRGNGSVALLGGSEGMSGAVILAARAAARSGSGYVTAGLSAAVDAIVSTAVPEVLTRALTSDAVLGAAALKSFADVVERADALAIGPGLGAGRDQASLVAAALAEVEVPVVLDADGLNVIAGSTEPLARRSHATVITPHPGELGRLLDVSAADIQADRLGSARRAVEAFGCVVLLKGHRTIVSSPGGETVVNPTGGPELATAGTGDVLTGIVTSLLAQGLGTFDAAWAGAYVHGAAGAIAARRLGVTGVLAGDVVEAVPQALLAVRLP